MPRAPQSEPTQVVSAAPNATGVAFPTVFAFFGSGCLLVLELVAARLIAPTLGVSLYTWTSVIGVVLGGVSLGNYLGGRLADRWPDRAALGLVYLCAALASLAVLGVLRYVHSLELPKSAPALLQVLWITAILFLLPSTILGAPTPLLTRLSLQSVERTGRVVGRIQAAAALGSIVGTFLTGFWLISWFGTRHIVAGVAAILLVLAIVARPAWLPRHVYEVGSVGALIIAAGWVSHSGCLRESSYYCIRVTPARVVGGGQTVVEPTLRGLYLDRLLHSVVDIRHPTSLDYGYEQTYAGVITTLVPPGSRLDSFFIGGGGFVFPRWLEAKYNGHITVAEIDPEVTRVARQYLGLATSARMKIVTGDARRELRLLPSSAKFDAVYGDAFDDFEVPYHLATREFDDLVARHLRPNGLYLLNVIDSVHYDFLRSVVRTLRLTFPHVGLLAPNGQWPPQGRVRGTFVIVAAKAPPTQPLPTVPAGQLDAFVAHGHSVVLTDDYAPVDQLLEPVFKQSLQN